MNTMYAKSCIGAAWDDIRNSEGWLGRTALLGLINIVPILNWVVSGYAMRWSRELIFDRIEPMPKQIFLPRAFVNGVYAFVISFILSLIEGLVGGILEIVPLLGTLTSLVLGFFINMFEYICIMRSAVADGLAPAFDVAKDWSAFKRDMLSLFVASVVPSLVVSFAVIFVFSIGGVWYMLFSGSDLMPLIYEALNTGVAGVQVPSGGIWDSGISFSIETDVPISAMNIPMLMQILVAALPIFLVFYAVTAFLSAFATLLSFRAMGHWVVRNTSDWLQDPNVLQDAYKYPMP